MIGVTSAPVKSVIVSIHSPVLKDTPSARESVGMSGAPRLDTTAIKEPMVTRVGTRSRAGASCQPTPPTWISGSAANRPLLLSGPSLPVKRPMSLMPVIAVASTGDGDRVVVGDRQAHHLGGSSHRPVDEHEVANGEPVRPDARPTLLEAPLGSIEERR